MTRLKIKKRKNLFRLFLEKSKILENFGENNFLHMKKIRKLNFSVSYDKFSQAYFYSNWSKNYSRVK